MIPPPLPRLEELEGLAGSTDPGLAVPWWRTAQAAHVLGAIAPCDGRTGDILPASLHDLLHALLDALQRDRPLPADPIQHAVAFLAGSLPRLLRQARTKIVRRHVAQPFHQLREMDAVCVDWLGRQPGRTVREKLAGRSTALGVVRELSVDTHENRALRRVTSVLGQYLERRLAALAAGAYEASTEEVEALERCHQLCVDELRRSPLADVPLSHDPVANNVLLVDADYSRVWRVWLWLRRLEADVAALWSEALDRARVVLFWAVVARLAARPDVCLADNLCRVDIGYGGAGFGLSGLTTGADWESLLSVVLVAGPRLPPNFRQAVIQHLVDDRRGQFGYLQAADGRHYFRADVLADGVDWENLQRGAEVVFVPGERRGTSDRLPSARQVGLPSRPVLVRLSLEEDGLRVTTTSLFGEVLLSPQEGSLDCRVFHLAGVTDQWEVGRGLAVSLTDDQRIREKRTWFADPRGLRETASRLAQVILADQPDGPSLPDPLAGQPLATAGLDLATLYPQIAANESLFWSRVGVYAVHYSLPDGAGEWLVGRGDRWPDVLGGSIERPVVTMFDLVVGGSGDPVSVREAVGRIFAALRDEIHADRLAYSVLDSIDEWSQYWIRSAAHLAFPQPSPIWRSVAAALGWQALQGFATAPVNPGDLVIVLDAADVGLTLTFLIARFDRRLAQVAPTTRGLYWERRACLSPAVLPEELGARARGLTFTSLQRDYLHQQFQQFHDLSETASTWAGWVQEQLLRTGVVERSLAEERTVWLPYATDRGDLALEVRYDRPALRDQARSWGREVAFLLRDIRGIDLFEELLDSVGNRWPILLLAGAPFHLEEVRDAVREVVRSLGWEVSATAEADRLPALGAEVFLRRQEEGLPAWRDWLPELRLEVVRNGHFDELPLLNEDRLEDASELGRELTIDVPERLLLPPGQDRYLFPLLVGRRRDRLSHDAVLRDRSFPLSRPLEAKLRLTHRQGFDQAYTLAVLAAPQGGPERRLEIVWEPRQERAARIPDPPPRRDWIDASLAEFREWVVRVAGQLNRRLTGASARGAPPLADWLQRSLEMPLRRLWDEGRSLATAPAPVRDAVARVILPRLAELHARPGAEDIQAVAARMLARLHTDAPEGFPGALAEQLRSGARLSEGLRLVGFALGDGSGERADLLDALLVAAERDLPDGRWAREVLRALSVALWRHPDLAPALQQRPHQVLRLIDGIERSLRAILNRLLDPQTAKGIDWTLSAWRFSSAAAVVLALLRLRDQPPFQEALRPQAPGMFRLAWLVRRLDRAFADRPVTVPSLLCFSMTKPPSLVRMSDLAYVLHCYLTGEFDAGHIQIASDKADDDAEE